MPVRSVDGKGTAMRARTGLVVLVLFSCLRAAEGAEPFWLGGIQVNEPDHGRWVDGLASAGMNAVAVTAYAKQGDWDSANLWFESDEPSVVAEIRAAKARGLSVVLILRVALDHAFSRNRFLWHGMIMPARDADVEEWFVRYGRFARQWADIAAREGVDALGIASEMSWLTSTIPTVKIPELAAYYLDPSACDRDRSVLLSFAPLLSRESLKSAGAADGESLDQFLRRRNATHADWARRVTYDGESDRLGRINRRRTLLAKSWHRLIKRVRAQYRGRLLYAANFDQYEEVGFWGELDRIGINAYFRLREDQDLAGAELDGALEKGWKTVLGRLTAFRTQNRLENKRVVFTELGYTKRRGATVAPWQMSGFSVEGVAERRRLVVWPAQPTIEDERARAVRALGAVSRALDPELLGGVLYWKLTTRPEHQAIEPFVLVIGSKDPLESALLELRSF